MSGSKGSFPRRSAATRRFTLGVPRSFAVANDGSRVVFLRSPAGDDPNTQLWVFDVEAGRERLVADAREVLSGSGSGEDLPAAERARRERTRETAAGVVAFSANPASTRAAFALNGRLFVADLVEGGGVLEPDAAGPVFDPRLDPTGARVAYVSGRALRVAELADRAADRDVAAEDDPNISWGAAEFVAGEEMGRTRGSWWSPDGSKLLAARVDISPVQRWHVADAAEPAAVPQVLAYPAAGTPNAEVSLALFPMDGGERRVDVDWDRAAFPYLVEVSWSAAGPALLLVQSRDQRTTAVLALDDTTGSTRTLRKDHDPSWLEIVPGIPAWTNDGRLLTTEDQDDTRRLLLDGEPVTPAGLQVRSVLDVGDGVLFAASEDPTEEHVWRLAPDGVLAPLSAESGVHTAVRGGDVVVLTSATMERSGSLTIVLRESGDRIGAIGSFAEEPSVRPRVSFLNVGSRELRTALLLPTGRSPGDGPLPVLVDPYGGPHHARVVKAGAAFLQSQWFADQGFAVVVTDGRGTPGRGPAWERAVQGDLAGPVLQDQVDALLAVAEANPGVLDLTRVGIRGWSFGGYLAALAVLRGPDVFHVAVAGAPVTDWSLYDTHYTERYLGTPQANPDAYARSGLLADAARLERPLMLIHGLADDNVVAAHTLRFSTALLAAGKPHTVLPLSGVTHMTPQEAVAENLLVLQVDFLRRALGLPTS